MDEKNPYVDSLVNWAETGQQAYLVLKYEGSSQSVRAFTSVPTTSIVEPRCIYFTSAGGMLPSTLFRLGVLSKAEHATPASTASRAV